jgi:hypothetical protein
MDLDSAIHSTVSPRANSLGDGGRELIYRCSLA